MKNHPLPSNVAICKGCTDYANRADVKALVLQAIEILHLSESFISPGDHVVIKPNWVKEHDERHPMPGNWEHVITHPSVIEATADWAASRLNESGKITICDAPQTDSSFEKIREYCKLDEMIERLRSLHPKVSISLLDLRPEEWHGVDGITVSKKKLPGDPQGSTHLHLDEASEFFQFKGLGKLFGASVDVGETNRKHANSNHEYLLCRTPMDADVFINIPKMKTHKKVGITCALKNLVGINANKNWLPHHTEGTPDLGGDQFPSSTTKAKLEHSWMGAAKRWMVKYPLLARVFVPIKSLGRLFFGDTQRVVRSGNWYGNDTCWRMVLDLNKGFFYFNVAAQPRVKPLRYLTIVDGIIGGEGNGPMSPDPVRSGLIIAGTHPLAVDCAVARCVGFDWNRIRMLRNAFEIRQMNFVDFKPEDMTYQSSVNESPRALSELNPLYYFKAHFGWKGAIELSPQSEKVPNQGSNN